MYKIKLISILFLLISLNISCKSTSYLSSDQKNGSISYYLYGLGKGSDSNSSDPNIICQYRCDDRPSSRGWGYSCDRYYFSNTDKLDKTTLELVQNPMAFKGSDKKGSFKTFKLKNLYDLFNYTDVIKDSNDNPRCNFIPYREDGSEFYLWTPDFNNHLLSYFEKPSYLTMTEEGKNNTWSKCTITYYSSVNIFQQEKGFCWKDEKGNYSILIVPELGIPVMKFNHMKVDIGEDAINMDFFKKYIYPSLEYLGLNKNDCLYLSGGSTKCISLNTWFTFERRSIDKPQKHLMLLTTFSEDDDLYFNEKISIHDRKFYNDIEKYYEIPYTMRVDIKK